MKLNTSIIAAFALYTSFTAAGDVKGDQMRMIRRHQGVKRTLVSRELKFMTTEPLSLVESVPGDVTSLNKGGLVKALLRRTDYSPASSLESPANKLTDSQKKLQALAVKTINDIRKKHRAKPLTTSNALVQSAQAYADKCHFEHSIDARKGRHGEILAATAGDHRRATIGTAIEIWQKEAKDYNSKKPVASHFTQLVWKSTTQVGCAVSKACNTPKTAVFVPNYLDSQLFVCHFSVAGNVGGKKEFRKNVSA